MRLSALLLALTLLATAAPGPGRAAEADIAPAAARRVELRFRPPAKDGTARDELRLDLRLSQLRLDPGLIASHVPLSVSIGDTLCLDSEPGDGGRWSRNRKRPWVWNGRLRATPGCVGKGRVALDLRSGALAVRLKRVPLSTVRSESPTQTPVRVRIGADTFLCHVTFQVAAKRWKHRDARAIVPIAYAPPEPDPDDDPVVTDGPVTHRELRSGAIYREDPHPTLSVTAIDARAWREVWERDWQAAFGPTVPEAGFPERMVVTFAGASGPGIRSVRFERSGNDLVGHVVVEAYAPSGGYQPSLRVFGAYEVPRVIGRVTLLVQIEGVAGVTEQTCSPWQPGW